MESFGGVRVIQVVKVLARLDREYMILCGSCIDKDLASDHVVAESVEIFLSHRGDYFEVELSSGQLSATCEVWAYADAYGLAELFEFLAKKSRSWQVLARNFLTSLQTRVDCLSVLTLRLK